MSSNDALSRAHDAFGSAEATSGDEVFRQLVLARIIEPTSKEDSVRGPLPAELRDALAQIN